MELDIGIDRTDRKQFDRDSLTEAENVTVTGDITQQTDIDAIVTAQQPRGRAGRNRRLKGVAPQ